MQSVVRWFSEARRIAAEIPAPTRRLQHERAERRRYVAQRATLERRSTVRGLILLAVVVLLGSIARAGLDRVFVHGWWRP
jgi:hypothetical protein